MDDFPLFDDDFDWDDEEDFYIVPVGKPAEDFVPEARYTLFQNLNLVQQRIIGVSDSVADLLDTIWWSHVRSMFDDYDDWRYGYTVVVYDDTKDVHLNISLEYLIECVYRIAYALNDTSLTEAIESHWHIDPIKPTNFWDSELLDSIEVALMLTDLLWLNELPEVTHLHSIDLAPMSEIHVITANCAIDAVLSKHSDLLEDIGLTSEQINGVVEHEDGIWISPFLQELSVHPETFYIRLK